ncbi:MULTISPECIES: hypothetical protein [Ferrimonas]|uniref:hypothetical protein n=1 Tax=Ferrimonas TaxID=44011 RepID=UPI00041E8C0A|nr:MULTISPECIES: hypothetical protein [Ferrimonas]USD36232.1 hypothetical protein J8Z22_14460 [Ferrimonas sp. SCSIO 43195]
MTATFRYLTALTLLIQLPTAYAEQPLATTVDQQLTPAHWSRLPLLGEQAKARGHELPSPIGVSLFFNQINADYIAKDDFSVQVDGGLLGGCTLKGCQPDGNFNSYRIPAEDVSISGEDRSVQLKIDAWILPFWNVYALFGHTEGSKDIRAKLDNVEGLPNVPDGIVLPIPIDYTATNYGLGTVLAGQVDLVEGWHPFVVMGVGALVKANTNTTDSVIKTRIASLRLGQRYDVGGNKLAWFLAYNHQNVNQRVSGSYNFAGVPQLAPIMEEVRFDLDLAKEETENLAISLNYDFGHGNNWNLYAEYGFLNWQHLIVGVGRRF